MSRLSRLAQLRAAGFDRSEVRSGIARTKELTRATREYAAALAARKTARRQLAAAEERLRLARLTIRSLIEDAAERSAEGGGELP